MALSIQVLSNTDFRRLMGARVFGLFGLQAQAVIIGWQVYSLTHDPFMLGLIGLAEAIPAIFCSLFSGHVVDISRPHRVYCWSLGTLMLLSFGLMLVAGGSITASPPHQLWFMFTSIILSGVARGFIMPASFTLFSRIVAKPDIPAASAWMSSGFQLAAISGPAIAGIIYGSYGNGVAWLIPFLSLATALFMAWRIDRTHRHYKGTEKREPAITSIKAGWAFIFSNRTLLSVMSLDMFAVLFGGAVAVLPVFADQVLGVGSEGLGLLRASPAIGSIITALYMALRPMQHVRGSMLLWVVAGFGVCMIGFSLAKTFWTAAFFLGLSGAFDSVSMVIRGTLMQLLIPDAMRGRVSAVNGMFIISSNEIGAFESGTAARLLGLVPSIFIGGTITVGIALATAWRATGLRRLVIAAHEKP